ncbi:nucleotidyltransferase domain-containing protein [Maridesulfovibrio frigidus]|uniref:nucleotidyltransferase domain-containing protein n=1 Tax=Maridesulfovibrio frigidus TaxID=340956 RepID=UPI0004E10519|nr:nucleotidyltransferase domain-containing protein [Maridesulfovibrio frigidus]
MHIYAFGSVCRGEIDLSSDIDLLAIVDTNLSRIDPLTFSIYSPEKIKLLWKQGNPFAWHLYYESRLLYSEDGIDYIESLGMPNKYTSSISDCRKFYNIFEVARATVKITNSQVFELSTLFLAVRNLATCYSLALGTKPTFSRNSALELAEKSLIISKNAYECLQSARILSVRGVGSVPSRELICETIDSLPIVDDWMRRLIKEVDSFYG